MKNQKLMISHGGKDHAYGADCKDCERVLREDPYTQKIIKQEKIQLIEELISEAYKTKRRSNSFDSNYITRLTYVLGELKNQL